MFAYTLRRLLLMIPTIVGVIFISFVISNFVPGGPVDRMIAQIQGAGNGVERGAPAVGAPAAARRVLEACRASIPASATEIEKQFGYDKPAWERFWLLLKGYATFDMGRSLFSQHSRSAS